MEATKTIKIGRSSVVPQGADRIAWLERWGVQPEEWNVLVVAPVRDWYEAGYKVDTRGNIDQTSLQSWEDGSRAERAIEAHLIDRLRADPTWLPLPTGERYDVSAILRAEADRVLAERQEAEQKELAKRQLAQARAQAIVDLGTEGIVDGLGGVHARAREHEDQAVREIASYLVHGSGTYHSSAIDLVPRALRAQIEETVKQRREAAKARKAEVEQAKEAQRVVLRQRLVERLGTPNQAARQAEGLLPTDEADALLRGVLCPVGRDTQHGGETQSWPGAYVKLTSRDVTHDDDCEAYGEARTHFCSETHTEGLTEAEYAALVHLRGCVQAAEQASEAILGSPATVKLEVRLHRGWCLRDECSGGVQRLGVMVRWTWEGMEVSQEYALD